jgi:octaprenyl-diphosphate synthase
MPMKWSACALFGELTGIAFQIKDDLFDYGAGAGGATGKPTGLDIKEKKLTLPLIHALQQVEERSPLDGGRGEEPQRGHARPWRAGAARVPSAGGIAHAERKRMLELPRQAPSWSSIPSRKQRRARRPGRAWYSSR